MQQSEMLSRALERSQRIGDLLVQREEAELQQVSALAEELIQREYSAPSREQPCRLQAGACLECYQQRADDITQCDAAVAAYAACARQASAAVLQAKA